MPARFSEDDAGVGIKHGTGFCIDIFSAVSGDFFSSLVEIDDIAVGVHDHDPVPHALKDIHQIFVVKGEGSLHGIVRVKGRLIVLNAV